MTAALHLARRYLRQHPVQTLLLVLALGLLAALPLVLRVVLREAETRLHERAAATPLVLGARASALDLVLSALHFRLPGPPAITRADVARIAAGGHAQAIPLYVRYHAQGASVAGTELEYFAARRLRLAQGTAFQRLGDCVLGSRVAARRDLAPGGSLVTSPEQAFDLAGSYPLKMRVTGVLAPTGTPDDDAIFVDLKTAWLIDGLAHGHDDLTPEQPGALLATDAADGNLVANASVRLYNEVTSENIHGFHFHGDPGSYPVTAALVFPRDAKADALLSGQYQKHASLQLVAPADLIRSLMDALFRLEGLLHILLAVTGAGVILVTALVFALTYRLRRREFQTLADLGIAPRAILTVKLLEAVLILLLAAALATALITTARLAAPHMVRLALG